MNATATGWFRARDWPALAEAGLLPQQRPFSNVPHHYFYVSREFAMTQQAQEYEFRIHRDKKTLFGSWVQTFWANQGHLHIDIGGQSLSLRMNPSRYGSMLELDNRIVGYFSLHTQAGDEWHRVPFLYDGSEWLIEYRGRLYP